jgi:hypothetical protein
MFNLPVVLLGLLTLAKASPLATPPGARAIRGSPTELNTNAKRFAAGLPPLRARLETPVENVPRNRPSGRSAPVQRFDEDAY